MEELSFIRKTESARFVRADGIVTRRAQDPSQLRENILVEIEPGPHEPPKTILPSSCTERP